MSDARAARAARAAQVALLYPGDRASRDRADPAASRFAALFEAFAAAGVTAEPAIWHDDFADEVRDQLRGMQVVLVWCNPIEDGRRRDRLDYLLREVAQEGVFVSAHPDAILRLGTKDVLLETRDLPFGGEVCLIDSLVQLAEELPQRVDMATLQARLSPYFESVAGGHMIDQAWQPRLPEGMVRAHLVEDRVTGFSHQAVNALHPAAPLPGPRLYHGPELAGFRSLRQQLESSWIGLLCERVALPRERLPLLWDCDFMLGEPTVDGAQRFVLCETTSAACRRFRLHR